MSPRAWGSTGRRKVLIVGINYAPEHTGIAPYTAGMARSLVADSDVQVVTAHPHYPSWSIAEGFGAWRMDHMDDGVKVRRLRHYIPGNPTGIGRIVSEFTFAARILATHLERPDVVLSVSPALLSVLAARALAKSWGVPKGVVVQDLYSRAASEAGLMGVRSGALLTYLESVALRTADGLVAIHERLGETMQRELGVAPERITVIPNWAHVQKSRADRLATRRAMGWGDETVLLHAGNMGAKQGLHHVVDAAVIAQRQKLNLRIVLMGDGSQRDALRTQGTGLSKIDMTDPVPDSDFSDVLAAADILLLHERPGVEEMCVPSKLTSYFASGRPVLAATSARSAAAFELRASGGGHVVDPGNPELLLAGIAQLTAQEPLEELGRRGQAYAAARLDEFSAHSAYRDWVATLLSR